MSDTTESKTKQPTWDRAAAEKEFIADRTSTIKGIADKYGVSRKTVSEYAKKRGWRKRREKVTEDALDTHEEETSKDLAKLNSDHETVFSNLYKVANKTLKQLDELKVPIPGKELAGIATAIKAGVEGVRIIRGLPVIIAKSESKIDIEEKVTPAEVSTDVAKLLKRKERLDKLMNTPEPTTPAAAPKPKAKEKQEA